MKVKEEKENVVKRTFESFSFTIGVQSEVELIELYHRFNLESGRLLRLYDDGTPPKWDFMSNNCTEIKELLEDKVKYYDVEV